MKVSSKSRYGLRILMDLVLHRDGNVRMIKDIAKSQSISEHYVARLVIDLRKGGLIHSLRGARGGFRIAVEPEAITLLQIVEAMEGPLNVVRCLHLPKKCPRSPNCAARDVWGHVNEEIRQALSHVTLADLIKRQISLDQNFDC